MHNYRDVLMIPKIKKTLTRLKINIKFTLLKSKIMTGIFIAYNQAYYEEVIELLEKNYSKGFTRWNEINGRGSRGGEPHMGSHTWPTFNDAILTFVEDEFVDNILNDLNQLDTKTEELGLRAFSWKIDKTI